MESSNLYRVNKEEDLEKVETEITLLLASIQDCVREKVKEKIGVENKEQIEAYYANQVLKDKILKTKNEIERLNKKYENEKENNLIYEKEAKIKELEDTILQLKSKLS